MTRRRQKKKAAPAPRQVWGEQETAFLIDLSEDRMLDIRRQRRNASVYDEIVEALRQAGYVRTRIQVQHKIENLFQTYRLPRPWSSYKRLGAAALLRWRRLPPLPL
ncbi:hypothetical protein MRX96_040643 [Rhipicephalus microplus]